MPQQRHASAPASTADETAMTGNDGSTDFDLALESNEVLAAMDDAAFTRAVTRCLASHRKIFSAQQNNWASVRLAANLAPTLRGVAAEDAKRQDRATARAADAIADRADPDDPGWVMSDPNRDPDIATVVVRRWENGASSGSTEEILQCLSETLPAIRNVPPYTSYIYSAHENSYVQDEVRRRLMLRDNEGELYHELSDSDASESDSSQRRSDVEGLGDDDDGTERRARRRTARAGKKERVAARLGKAKAELSEEYVEEAAANHKPIDEAEAKQKADEAAANRHWDKRTDYLIYAAAVCLGTTTRCIEAVSANLRLEPRILRARMRTLQKARNARGGEKNERIDRRGVSIAAVHEGAKAAHEAGVRAAQEYRAALAVAKGDAKVGEEEGDVEIKMDPGSDEEEDGVGEEEGEEGTGSGGKEREKANEKDGGDDAGPEITRRATRGMADASVVPVRRKDSRETKLWNLVAWRFLSEPDSTEDVHGGGLPRHADVDPALDSFRTLYCPRCHHYDCNLHGCGHAQPTVKLGEEEASRNPHHRSKTHMEAVRRAAKEAEEAAAAAAAAAATGRKTRGQIDRPALAQPPCGPRCWLMDASARGNASADAPTGASPIRFDAARIKREAGEAATARAEKAKAAPRRSPRGTPQKQTTNTPRKSPRVTGGEGPAAGDADAAEAEVDFLNERPVSGGVDADAVVSTPVRQTDPKPAPRWSSFDESYYAKMRVVYGDGGDPCAIARAIDGPSCVEVYRRLRADLQREGEAEASRSEHHSDAEDEEGRGGGGGRGGNRRKGGKKRKGWITQRKRTTTAVIRRRMQGNEEDHVWTQYTPCECGPGGCKAATCACMSDGNFCEKYCSCRGPLSRCANAFTGCNCRSGTCGTRACPCFAAARECDPEICKRCAHTAQVIAHERRDGWPFTDICEPVPAPPKEPTEATAARNDPNEQCGNMKLYLRQHKHACLGLSGVEGWGCFLKNGARKNELLGEYTGELISQTEADRRGKIYDKLNSSFLFNLNDQWVLDAAVRGNKLKFANHSATPNCYAKVLMVRGDHRVGIFAKEHIAPGEELTYDYRYEVDKAPDWALKPTEMED